MPNYEARLDRLEQRAVEQEPPVLRLRIMRTIIDPQQQVIGAHAEGQSFDRLEGETVEQLYARVETAIGWNDA